MPVDYTLGQWQALTVFTADGAMPIDNNVIEREMKRVVLKSKNSSFVGNPAWANCGDPGQLDHAADAGITWTRISTSCK